MRLAFFIICLVFSSLSCCCAAPSADTSLTIPKSWTKNSSYSYLELADSCSKLGDSVNASFFYLKLHPYFLLRLHPNASILEQNLAGLSLTARAKDSIRQLLNGLYSTGRSEAYTIFEKMYAEDQETRSKYDRCGDAYTCRVYKQRMMHADSTHFDYLFNYVRKNGWPSFEHGSMFAQLLAHHDPEHMAYYLPELKKAVIGGFASLSLYNATLNRAKPSKVEAIESHENKLFFDISYVLRKIVPSDVQIKELQRQVKECGPVKYMYFIYEAPDLKDFKQFRTDNFSSGAIWDFVVYAYEEQNEKNAPFDVLYAQSKGKQKKLKLYIAY